MRQRLQSEAPEIISWERVDWADGCFEVDVPDGCPLSVSPVPGYRVVMELNDEEYVARTDVDGSRYALEAAPLIQPFDVVYRWVGEADAWCLAVELADNGKGSVASCGAAPTPIDLQQSGVGSLQTLDYLRSAATFEASERFDPSIRELYVRGTIVKAPGRLPRAAVEWGRHLAIESYTGRSSAAMALAIGWRDDNAEGCTDLQFMLYGAAYLSGCPEGGDGVLFLNDAQLQQLCAWIDSYRPFEVPGDETYLIFSGAGDEVASEAVQEGIRDWLQSPPWAPATVVE